MPSSAPARQAVVERVLGGSRVFDGLRADGRRRRHRSRRLALRLAGGLLPAAYRSRVVLLSDGQQTSGDAAAQARLLQARGVRVDVLPLAPASGPEVLIDQLAAPTRRPRGRALRVRVQVVSNVETYATVRVCVGDERGRRTARASSTRA